MHNTDLCPNYIGQPQNEPLHVQCSVASVFPFSQDGFELDSNCCHGTMRFHLPGSPFGAPTTGTRSIWGNWGHDGGGWRMVDRDDVHTWKFLTLEFFAILFIIFKYRFGIFKFLLSWKASTDQEASLRPDHLVSLKSTRCANKTRLNHTCIVSYLSYLL